MTLKDSFYTYFKVPWSLCVKKEVFSPTEKIESLETLDLIFVQIMKDYLSTICARITERDRNQLTSLLGKSYQISIKL